MRRRSLLFGGLGLAALGAGAAVPGVAWASSAGTGASAIMSSTQASTLAARNVTAFTPTAGTPPTGMTGTGQVDYTFRRQSRSLHTRVWYPLGSAGPYPLIVFSHGLLAQPTDYTKLLTSWARAGYVVAAPWYPHTSYGTATYNIYDIVNQPADASAVLTQVMELTSGPLAGKVDATRLIAAGHSAGGITTTGLFSARRDTRLTAGVVIAGTDFLSSAFTGPAAAMLFVQGKNDATVRWNAAHTVFEAVPWSRAMLTVTDGEHQLTTAQTAAVATTSVQFLDWSMYGGTPGLTATSGVTTLDDQLGVS